MTSTFHGLELGKRALYAQQAALSTTGQNIANANTAGYTRQRAEMQATNALPAPGMNNGTSPAQLGTGVEVNKLVRLREDYLDVQYRGENKNLGYWEAKSDTLSKVEEIMNEPSDTGLANSMDEFWNAWQELAKNPDSSAVRAVLRQRGVALADTFNQFANSLDQMQTDLKNVIETKTSEINSLATQVASLNDQISRIVPNNYQPNDLYDQRDLLLDQLSKLVDVKVSAPSATGMVNVSVGGELLVSGQKADKLTIGYSSTADGTETVTNVQIGDKTIKLESGELLGRLESFGVDGKGTLPDYKNKLNQLVAGFVNAVNTVHNNGQNLVVTNGGVVTQSAQGVDFFTGTTAKDIQVNAAIMNSLDLIAAAKEEANGTSSTGNGQNAQEMADLKSKPLPGMTSTAADFYSNMIGQLGIDSQQASRMQENSEVIINQVENRRQSVSGVSLDEEMANMIKYQQAYNAAARVVNVMDECLDKIINGMGRAGL
ncbi:flagellar hook-associated protein FlgK [Bacillus sp. ISL-18]|uniref:flagellar hook-associated protein FlgK n=1 Tax=Bacillus sp. ISL-18 TaxID=2819118 RepID=UPI001BE7AC41|nr:flagellar hook-associated protein FlgK [Bacillus sp. ISL-18]MBT2657818.1 flagellar hook-associated protein FlgK [Bacillus sp. ISL-18]